MIKFPTTNSNFVMTADILVANESIDYQSGCHSMNKLVLHSGTIANYRFADWTDAEEFLDRLPRRMPSNKVTFLKQISQPKENM